MNYEMRRKDREQSREETLAVLDKADYGVLSTVDSDGAPYCIPLSLAREGDLLYFHCALSGHKIDNLKRDPRVCVSFSAGISFPENNFTVIYESAIVTGRAEELRDKDEKIHGLKIISQRFTPAHMDAFDEAAAKSLDVTGVWKIHIAGLSGKRRKKPA